MPSPKGLISATYKKKDATVENQDVKKTIASALPISKNVG